MVVCVFVCVCVKENLALWARSFQFQWRRRLMRLRATRMRFPIAPMIVHFSAVFIDPPCVQIEDVLKVVVKAKDEFLQHFIFARKAEVIGRIDEIPGQGFFLHLEAARASLEFYWHYTFALLSYSLNCALYSSKYSWGTPFERRNFLMPLKRHFQRTRFLRARSSWCSRELSKVWEWKWFMFILVIVDSPFFVHCVFAFTAKEAVSPDSALTVPSAFRAKLFEIISAGHAHLMQTPFLF